MNYLRIYNQLIAKAVSRKVLEGYTESHHITPKCMGGTNEKTNLVTLSASEHYLAHLLLLKIHPNSPGLAYAVHIMSTSRNVAHINNKSYAWAKKRHAEAVSLRHTGKVHSEESLLKMRDSAIGKKHSKETRLLIAENSRAMWRNMSEETRASLAENTKRVHTGKKLTEEHKRHLSEIRTGTTASEETKQLLSRQRKGVPKSEAHRKAIAEANTGHAHSEETKRKIGEASKGRVMSEATKKKMLESRAVYYANRKLQNSLAP